MPRSKKLKSQPKKLKKRNFSYRMSIHLLCAPRMMISFDLHRGVSVN
jgi:hypothetical protein